MRKEKKILILVGIPGSGKSTWALEFLAANEKWLRVNRDSYRGMLRDQTICQYDVENLITTLSYQAIESALLSGFNVIIDNTHCKKSYLDKIVEKFNSFVEIEFKYFEISVAEAVARDSGRSNPVGEEVIQRMYNDLQQTLKDHPLLPLKSQGLSGPKSYINTANLEKAIIFDIDGTLAHMNGKRGPFDWHSVDVDDVDPIVSQLARDYVANGVKVFVVSGRDEAARELTEQWLATHHITYEALYMRPRNDYRKDTLIKAEIYDREFRGKYYIEIVYDDREVVCDMWRSLGLKCFQVEPGKF